MIRKKDLKDIFENNRRWAEWSAKVVVAGLALDIVVLLLFSANKSWLETTSGIFATFVIAAGVWAEIHFDGKSGDAATELQRISDEKIAESNAIAETARERANQLALDLDRERAARLPRGISAEQRKILVDLLLPELITKGKVIINPAMDGEAWQFGDAIVSVLKEAGFSAEIPPLGARVLAFNKLGAFIWIKDAKKQPKHAGPIFEAFKRVGIFFTGEEHSADAEVPDLDTVVIAISTRF